jgi:hypothetical protein
MLLNFINARPGTSIKFVFSYEKDGTGSRDLHFLTGIQPLNYTFLLCSFSWWPKRQHKLQAVMPPKLCHGIPGCTCLFQLFSGSL